METACTPLWYEVTSLQCHDICSMGCQMSLVQNLGPVLEKLLLEQGSTLEEGCLEQECPQVGEERRTVTAEPHQ